tara:strand:- start:556 stop:837 length:282 start_codon:yes stop_codon:yes gene_type:complete
MSEILLHSPIGKEATFDPDITPILTPRGGKIAFLFNGHVSVLPFWNNLESEIKSVLEPTETMQIVKPNTFAPASAEDIESLSSANLAIVGVCA